MKRSASVVLLGVLLSGCATVPRHAGVYGRAVTVMRTDPDGRSGTVKVTGELIAVDAERLWVLAPRGLTEIPRADVRKVSVERHAFTGGRALKMAAVATVLAGTALTASCGSVEGNGSECAATFLPVALTYGVVGGMAAATLHDSSRYRLEPARLDDARRFSRFPQGMPEGVDAAAVGPPPPAAPPRR